MWLSFCLQCDNIWSDCRLPSYIHWVHVVIWSPQPITKITVVILEWLTLFLVNIFHLMWNQLTACKFSCYFIYAVLYIQRVLWNEQIILPFCKAQQNITFYIKIVSPETYKLYEFDDTTHIHNALQFICFHYLFNTFMSISSQIYFMCDNW